jgi:predicted Zn-dependent peptidase
MLTLVLLVGLLFPEAVLSADRPQPEHARTADGATLVVHRQPALPVVALRLSIVANDPPGYAGAGHMMQHLLFPALQDRVHRVGGAHRCSGPRTLSSTR